jgi:hypothetical protein
VIVIGHVARSVNVLNVGAGVLVHQDSVAGLHAAVSHELDNWLHAHTDDREITIDALIACGDHSFDAAVSLEARHDVLEDRFDAMTR